jgi:succinate dehydrogenase/fumarate reductase flavoprotein subunit
MDYEEQTDVVVVGGGMAGLVSAAQILEHDTNVIVLEKGSRLGGSMYLSAGVIYTYDSLQALRDEIPEGDEELQRLIVESKESDLQWLDDLGITLTDIDIDLPFGSGRQVDPKGFTDEMVDKIENVGGDIRVQTPMVDIYTNENTEVVGVKTPEETIRANAVILATGGFQGNEELVEQYITDNSENLWLRSNPWSTGDGLLCAKTVGAKWSNGLGTFYGHNLPAPPAVIPPDRLLESKQLYGIHAIAINESGERFADESTSRYEEGLAQDTAKLADGRAYYILDQNLYDSNYGDEKIGTMVEIAEDLGGRVAEADSLDDLRGQLLNWGVNGSTAIRTIEEFNEAIRQDQSEQLTPPRRDNQRCIDTPPFYAVEVQPGITYTMGGLSVNEQMEVLRRNATSSSFQYYPRDADELQATPIEGLYAAGMDVGNITYRQYMGGLVTGLVTGRIAGKQAAQRE